MKFSNEVNQVKISNLHKIKGLQAPVVILAAPHVMNFGSNKYVDRDHKILYFSNISVENNFGNRTVICESKKYNDEIAKANLESEAEERRVEYVAATRAESVLIIGKPDKVNEGYRNPWQHLLTEDLEEIPNYDSQETNPVIEQYEDVIKEHHSIVNNDSNQQSYFVHNPSALRVKVNATNVDDVEENTNIDFNKALLGTLIHRLLECIVTSRNSYDVDKLTLSIFDEYALSKKHNADIYELLTKVGRIFAGSGFKQSSGDVPQNLLQVLLKAEEVMCEVPFAYKTNNSIVSGVIDLLYKDSIGWHIIDYKTNAEGDIGILEEEYQKQLAIYKKAFKQATGLDCDTHIDHIDI